MKLKIIAKGCALALSFLLALAVVVGCAPAAYDPASGAAALAASGGAPWGGASQASATTAGTPGDGIDFSYSDRDQDASYDVATATKIELAQAGSTVSGAGAGAGATAATVEGAVVTINAAGTYILSGILTDGQILVDATSEDKIQLVLNGVDVTNSTGSALLVEQADKVFVTLAPGSQNTLADGAVWVDEVSPTITEEDGDSHSTHDGTIFSHDDITFNGSGALTVKALAEHAIVSKDDLTITGGTYDLTAVGDTLQGKDSLKILDGVFTLDSGDDAIAATKEGDATKGWVAIDGGSFDIKAADHLVDAEGVLRTTDGKLVGVSSNEGLQGAYIQIRGGSLEITAKDDGINASSDYFADRSLVISDGYVYVDAQGDGLDSNSTFTVEGGTVVVNGPSNSGNGALDAEKAAYVTGGTVVAVGAGGMAQSFDASSSQASFSYTFANNQSAGTVVSVTDEQGRVLFSLQGAKSFNSLVFSSAELIVGGSYKVYVGGLLTGDAVNGYSAGGDVSGATLLTSFVLSQATAGVSADGTVGAPQSGMGGPGGGAGEGAGAEAGAGGRPERGSRQAPPA